MERVIVISVFLCMMMAALHVAHAVVFTILGEKCVWLIKSYRELPKEKRKCYDAALVVAGARNQLFLWALWFVAGAIVCFFVTPFLVIVFLGVWLAVFFPRRKFSEIRYEKYKKISLLDNMKCSGVEWGEIERSCFCMTPVSNFVSMYRDDDR